VLGSSAVLAVTRVYIHHLFNLFNYNNDLAVLRVKAIECR
jgi:hypothetical protein